MTRWYSKTRDWGKKRNTYTMSNWWAYSTAIICSFSHLDKMMSQESQATHTLSLIRVKQQRHLRMSQIRQNHQTRMSSFFLGKDLRLRQIWWMSFMRQLTSLKNVPWICYSLQLWSLVQAKAQPIQNINQNPKKVPLELKRNKKKEHKEIFML